MVGLRCAVIVLAPLALSACVVPDASKADGAWAPKGLNAANLAAMVVNPADLSHGRGDQGLDRKLGARAVNDLWSSPSPIASSGGGSAGGAQSGGAASGGASSGSGSAASGSGN